MSFENLSQKTMNYYLSNNFERNKQMIREIREYINADSMNKDWVKNNLNKQYNKHYINTFLKLFNKYSLNKMRESVRGGFATNEVKKSTFEWVKSGRHFYL